MDPIDPCRLYVGTDDGVRVFEVVEGTLRRVGAGLDGETVREFAVDPRDPDRVLVACGLRGWGLHLTADGGRTFEPLGLEDRWVWGVTLDPTDPDVVYAGTEPAMLYRSRDGGRTWAPFPGIEDLPSFDEWTFFYEQFGTGHVHGIAVDPADARRVYAAVEHGAMLYTHDGGETWHEGMAGADAHDTAVVPADPDRVLLSTGDGLYLSDDSGVTWRAIDRFDGLYVTDLAVSPHDPRTIYADAVSGSGQRDARVVVTRDGGDRWEPVGDPPPASVTGCDLLAVHPTDPGTVFHATHSDANRIVVATDDCDDWRAFGPDLPHVRAVAAGPRPG